MRFSCVLVLFVAAVLTLACSQEAADQAPLSRLTFTYFAIPG